MRLLLRLGLSHYNGMGCCRVSMCCGWTRWYRIVSNLLRTMFPDIFPSRLRRAHIRR